MKLLFVGYATVDIIQGSLHPGGAAAVMAINGSKLGHDCSLLTILSQDTIGKFYQSVLKKYSVDFSKSFLKSPSVPTCTIPRPHDLGSQRIWSDNGANKFINKITISPAYLAHFDGIFVANSHPDLAERIALDCIHSLLYIPGPQAVLKPNYIRQSVLKKSRIVFGNEEEAPYILKQKPFDCDVEIMVITKGKSGGTVYTKNGESHRYTAPKVKKVIDPTGAGDAFALGFGIQYLKSNTIEESITSGTLLASRTVAHEGALLI